MTGIRRQLARLALVSSLVLALGSGAPTVSAQSEPAFVPYCFPNATFGVESGQDINLFCGWSATTKGLLRSFLTADVLSFTLTDESGTVVWSLDAKEAAAQWGTPTSVPASNLGGDCPGDVIWATTWSFVLPALPDGTYTLTTNESFRHPVNDGFHTCSFDGVKVPAPSLYRHPAFETNTVTIVVG